MAWPAGGGGLRTACCDRDCQSQCLPEPAITRLKEATLDEALAGMLMGSAVLMFAALFVVIHYRREHRRAQLLRQLDPALIGKRAL